MDDESALCPRDEARKSFKSRRMKVISFGPEESGKSCIIKRFCEKRFVSKYLPTIGIDYGVTKFQFEDEDVKIDVFDLAGQPFFYEVRNEFYSGAHGAFLVFDVCNKASFDALGGWLLEMRNHLTDPDKDMDSIVIVVCGNKTDLSKRKISESEAKVWAEVRGFAYFETSAQSGQGIPEMFEYLFQESAKVALKGERPTRDSTKLGYTLEQANLIQHVVKCSDSHEVLGLQRNCTKDEVMKAFRRLAVLLHPDKNLAPGSSEAFKLLTTAKDELLKGK
jgi:DnaJ family protein C protein 27